MNPRKLSQMPSDTDRVSWKIPEDKLADFKAAMEYFDFGTNAEFVRVCVDAIIRSHKAGEKLSRPLMFCSVVLTGNGKGDSVQ